MLLLLLACGSDPTDTHQTKPFDSDTAAVPIDSADTGDSRVDSGGGDSPVDSDSPAETDSPADSEETGDSGAPCADACDDGLDCTDDACDDAERCIHTAIDVCEWPASLPPAVTALAGLDEDFEISLSGATWNATTRELWVVRGNGATAWRLVEDGGGGWEISEKTDLGNLDVESIVLADPVGQPDIVHLVIELEEVVMAFDVSSGSAVELQTWDTSAWLPTAGSWGSEGMTFVPDDALAEWGFVDGDGAPRTSALGYGGLFFVGTQNGGDIHVFDLSATDATAEEVGVYATARTDTSGLEFDAGTGRLYVWHGGDDNDLEIVRLTSSGDPRSFDTEAIFDYPGDDNLEGIALEDVADCGDGTRSLFFTIDDGKERALDVYTDWPICGP